MSPDRQRVGTYFSYKGFQWEPGEDDTDAGSIDFLANRKGKPCFRGTILSIESASNRDTSSAIATPDDKVHKGQQYQLPEQLKGYLERDETATDDLTLPVVVVIVNHAQRCGFEDLSAILATLAPETLSQIHLFIWFDDFKGDIMLFCQTDPGIYNKLFNWFHV